MPTLVIPSVFEQLERVLEFIEQFAGTHQLGEDIQDRLMLLGSEAATNAIEHGNNSDPDKKVMLQLNLTDGQVILTVEDEGRGFNPQDVADPLSEENLLMASGRGLFLMSELADDVSYEDQGRRIRLTFKVA